MSHQANDFFGDDLTGRVINDRFRIIKALARDASGRVYRAEQLPLGRPVAIKVLDPRAHGEFEDEPTGQFQQRFLLEASVASRLQHPNTVAVFDYGRTKDGIYFIAFELVDGARSLQALLREEGRLEPARVVHIALQIARSLREAHRIGVVHRDLKPGCVLLTRHADEHDFVKLLDFGLVTRSEPAESSVGSSAAGLYMGSPKYMAPEQIRGDQVDSRTDVYALGVCMYEMLMGQPPFHRGNTVHILMAHMHEAPPLIDRVDCPAPLASLVMRCLAKNPAHRPPSMDEVIVLLKQALGRQLGSTTPSMLITREFTLPPEVARVPAAPAAPAHGGMLASTPVSGSITMTQPLHTPSAGRPSVPPLAFEGFTTALPSVPPARSSGLAKAAVVSAVVVAAGLLALRSVENRQMQAQVLPPAASVVPPAAATSAQEAHPQPLEILPAVTSRPRADEEAWVRVSLASDPPGAMVSVFDKLYGPTPANVELWGEQVARGTDVRFVFEKEGYESVSVSRHIASQELELDVELPRKPGYSRSHGHATEAVASSAPAATSHAHEEPYERPAEPPALPPEVQAAPSARAQESAPAAQPALDAPRVGPVGPAPVANAAPAPTPAPSAAPQAQVPSASVPSKAPAASPAPPRKVQSAVRMGDTVFPEYPRAARRAGVSGIVVARVAVRADGTVGSVDVLEGPEVFYDSVRAALRTWRYRPAKLADGTSVPDTHVVRIPFKLN
jgi:serine/threonine-protein kinase